ncbi:MAG: glucose-6-phosphate isomerase [Gammaproteobacteria bacterium]|nr:glucose-6-phosphate isomerase [Gammaproteobacteria bacterium]
MNTITATPEWQKLLELRGEWQGRSLRELLDEDPARAHRYLFEGAGIQLDVSRQRIDDDVLDALLELLRLRDFPARLEALWRGDAVNHTEGRAALHVAYRAEADDGVCNDDIMQQVVAQREAMLALAEQVRDGTFAAPAGGAFKDIVHIGIGGSHLGPELLLEALDDDASSPQQVHFLTTADPHTLQRLLARLDPERTLVSVVSKSFRTAENVLNAATLRDWLADRRGVDVDQVLAEQFIGVSANADAMAAFGIPAERQLGFDPALGGRYSVWSAVGLPLAIKLGRDGFLDVLAGARDMDRHFRTVGPRENLPILLALVGIWNINFFDVGSHGVLPYSNALDLLPDYLQQLEMESNGKQVDRDGQPVEYRTAPVIWGNVGMNAQHAFFQHLHQGTGWVPLDVIMVDDVEGDFPEHRDAVLANALAQMEALNVGRTEQEVLASADEKGEAGLVPYKVFPGNRPSSLIMLDRLDARRLGALLAMYEHKVYVQSVIWNINPFDQFGVEFGKALAGDIDAALAGDGLGDRHDAVAQAWVKRLKR